MRKDELNLYIDQLWCDGRHTYEDLRDAELEVLTGMIMQKCTVSQRWEYISETAKSDELPNALMNLFLSGDSDCATDLLAAMKDGAKQYAKHRIDELFEQRAELEAHYNPTREPSETELMIAAHQREIVQEMRRAANA